MKDGLNINSFGDKYWYKNRKLHREDGPAIEYTDGTKMWYINGERHRIDGPAIERNGRGTWYLNGKMIMSINCHDISCQTQEEFLRIFKLKAFL